MPSNPQNRHEEYRNKLLGLGESSLRKNYYPELRKHMRELEESRTRYEAIFNATADGLIIHDAQTYDIIDVNDCACEMFGYSESAMHKINLDYLNSGEQPFSQSQATDLFQKALTDGFEYIEWKCKRKDGSIFWADIILKRAIIADNQSIIASIRDITSRKSLEDQLLHSQKMEAMGQLAGGVAHDFNNMLSGIIGSAEIIKKLSSEDSEIRKLSDIILKAADTAGSLTAQLLSFSRKGNFSNNSINIHQAIHNATDILQRSIARNIELVLNLNAENDLITGDLSLFENIILNLSINARDAMPEGGILTISTENVTTCPQKYQTNPQRGSCNCICISISDTGAGIPDEIKQRIFEPFFTTKEKGKGTGLGLAAVYGTIQKHKGYIDVTSSPDNGTTFNIFIPVITRADKKEPRKLESVKYGSGKILLIDDEEILRYIGKSSLNSLGYEVITAEDGIMGIEAFKNHSPDLVLLDMVMPNMSSTDCYYELKKLSPDTPIIAVSGYSSDGAVDELINNGLSGFLEKPYKTKDLSNMISSLLSPKKD